MLALARPPLLSLSRRLGLALVAGTASVVQPAVAAHNPSPVSQSGLLRAAQQPRSSLPRRSPRPLFRSLRFSTLAASMAPINDPNTLSNHHDVVTKHTSVDVALDFAASKLAGTVTLSMAALKDVHKVILDTSYVDVQGVKVDGQAAKWTLTGHVEPNGSALTVKLPSKLATGNTVDVQVAYSTTGKCSALQWMDPEQTSNKKHPYMFSQCQAIHARSCYPCQDTPAVKSKFTISIRSPLPVVASGLPTGTKDFKNGTLAYTFEQPIPIPSYLFALASGDIASASIGPRSMLYTGPEELLECKKELEGDCERFIEVAESLVYPYSWTTYNVLIMPPSFPYGGMENVNMTFATPTIISGDKSNIDVIAHELSHSWSGNLVSTGSWEHFWLNEGWTTYLERRIGAVLHGDKFFDFSAIIGWKALTESVKLYGDTHEFTKLVQNLEGEDPEDAFSSVPYEKGFAFLYFLDRTVGREKWDKFIPHYFRTYKEKSLTSDDFKETLLSYFASDATASSALSAIDWDKWYYTPGLPPKPDFDTTLVDVCYALADKWISLDRGDDGFVPAPSDVDTWSSGQKVVFLERLTDLEKPLSPDTVEKMRGAYGFLESRNAEILSRFLTLGLKAKDPKLYSYTADALGGWGRLKFVRPLYRLLNECDRELAIATFKKHYNGYHPICKSLVEKDLKLV